jgi:hypothetical protein
MHTLCKCGRTTNILWDFRFSRRVWSWESSGMYCHVLKWMLTDVSEVRAASIIRAVHPRRLWTSTNISYTENAWCPFPFFVRIFAVMYKSYFFTLGDIARFYIFYRLLNFESLAFFLRLWNLYISSSSVLSNFRCFSYAEQFSFVHSDLKFTLVWIIYCIFIKSEVLAVSNWNEVSIGDQPHQWGTKLQYFKDSPSEGLICWVTQTAAG